MRHMTTTIALIGGHGKIAQLATTRLVELGNRVRSVIRSESQTETVEARGAEAYLADIEDPDLDLAALLDGVDLVIWAAGAGGGDPQRTMAVDRDAAIRMMQACARHGIRDFMMVSYWGARTDHGVDPENAFWHYAEAKAAADARLRASELDWVIVAPTLLTLETGNGAISAEITVPDATGLDPAVRLDSVGEPIAREDVAHLVAELVEPMVQGRIHHVTVSAAGGRTPIAEVVDQTVQTVRNA